jgi:hypothetical protein
MQAPPFQAGRPAISWNPDDDDALRTIFGGGCKDAIENPRWAHDRLRMQVKNWV